MENNESGKTILEIDAIKEKYSMSGTVEYEAVGDDRTVLDDAAGGDYVKYGEGAGFTFEVEGVEEENELPLTNHLQPDMTLKENRYRIIRTVGAGGFGVVYQAFDSKLNIEVGIKELFPSSLVNRVPGEKKMVIYGKDNARQYAYLLDRFILEARSMAKFNSVKNIVNIFDCFQENNTAYIVMEFIKGKTLEQYVIDNGGKLDVDKASEIMCNILDGLTAIHAKGIIHRDIKPKNIFINEKNELKIIDFGAARFSSTEEQIVTRYSKVLTPGFAPPEQYRKDSKQGPYTDIYAASAVYYYMLTGTVPEISVDRVVNDDIMPLGQVAENVPECVERAISRALELNSDLRLQTAEELKNGILGKKLIRTVKEEKKMRFRRRILIIASTAAALCIAAVGVVAYKLEHAKDITIDRLLKEDTSLSVTVPLSQNGSVANSQLAAWSNAAENFAIYVEEGSERKVTVELDFASDATYSEKITGTQKPSLYCLPATEESPKLSYMEQMTGEETTILYEMYEEKKLADNSYIVAFDPTVMYANKKLLAELNVSADGINSIQEIINLDAGTDSKLLTINLQDKDYYDKVADYKDDSSYFDPLEEFCMGNVAFYIGHVSDMSAVGEALPGLYSVQPAPDVDGVRAVGYEWQVRGDCDENELNAAQLMLSYLLGEDMQDSLFVQSGHMVPVNPSAFEKFFEFNPDLLFIKDKVDKLFFA